MHSASQFAKLDVKHCTCNTKYGIDEILLFGNFYQLFRELTTNWLWLNWSNAYTFTHQLIHSVWKRRFSPSLRKYFVKTMYCMFLFQSWKSWFHVLCTVYHLLCIFYVKTMNFWQKNFLILKRVCWNGRIFTGICVILTENWANTAFLVSVTDRRILAKISVGRISLDILDIRYPGYPYWKL